MSTTRMEAFTDAVIAIILTIMVLELKVPHGTGLDVLRPLVPVMASYVLSFVYIGIYWNNHHHLLHACHRVTGSVLWANLHLMFWLSLVPFTTGWMGENHFATVPTAAYGVVLVMAGFAYLILQQRIIAAEGDRSLVKRAIGSDWKGKASPALYALAIVLAFVWPLISLAIYAAVAIMWFIPDRRLERVIEEDERSGHMSP
ncbi:MAG TPA: TMEM175 family protein [Gemmatimonadales bacterium]|nr:TMEM175 family protein [Gemmatimonadales bacterium]